MKKTLLLFVVIFAVQTTVGQPPEYFVDNWYLHSFSFNGEEFFINTLDISEGPTLIIKNDYTLQGKSFCNTYYGSFEYIDNAPFAVDDNFIPRNIVRQTEDCGDLEEMETHYFLPFVEEKTADIIVVEPSGDEKYIVLQYNIGYQVYRNFPALGIEDISIKDLIVFPNPAQNKLIIQSVINEFDSITIADINGRIVMHSAKNNLKEVDISNLKAGMYFIQISSSEGNITKKFIKN